MLSALSKQKRQTGQGLSSSPLPRTVRFLGHPGPCPAGARATMLGAGLLGRGVPASAVCSPKTVPSPPFLPSEPRVASPHRSDPRSPPGASVSRPVTAPHPDPAAAPAPPPPVPPPRPPRAAAVTAGPNVAGPAPPPCPTPPSRTSWARGGRATHTIPGLRGARGGAGLREGRGCGGGATGLLGDSEVRHQFTFQARPWLGASLCLSLLTWNKFKGV